MTSIDQNATSPYAERARSLYFEAHTIWAAGTFRGGKRGCPFCAIPAGVVVRIGEQTVDPTAPALSTGCPLPHVLAMRVAETLADHPAPRPWMEVALARQVWRLFLREYGPAAPGADWSPTEDDPGAWVQTPQETRRQLDEWGQ